MLLLWCWSGTVEAIPPAADRDSYGHEHANRNTHAAPLRDRLRNSHRNGNSQRDAAAIGHTHTVGDLHLYLHALIHTDLHLDPIADPQPDTLQHRRTAHQYIHQRAAQQHTVTHPDNPRPVSFYGTNHYEDPTP